MFQINNNTYIEQGYLIEVEDLESTLTISLTKEDSIDHCFKYTFKLYGRYQNQINDLVDDCIGMYERKIKELN